MHDLESPDPNLRQTQKVDSVKPVHWIPISIIRSQTHQRSTETMKHMHRFASTKNIVRFSIDTSSPLPVVKSLLMHELIEKITDMKLENIFSRIRPHDAVFLISNVWCPNLSLQQFDEASNDHAEYRKTQIAYMIKTGILNVYYSFNSIVSSNLLIDLRIHKLIAASYRHRTTNQHNGMLRCKSKDWKMYIHLRTSCLCRKYSYNIPLSRI